MQFFATGKLIERFGVGPALALLPLVFAAGFAVLAAAPVLAVVIAFQALQRTANFAISNPAREVLFTVLARDEKYKAKNVIDIVAVRGADAAGGWLFTALRSLGMEIRSIPLVAIALAAAGLALALALGRAQERRAGTRLGYSTNIREAAMGIGWIFLAIIVALVVWAIAIYNGLVALRNRFKNAFAQIDVQLKRRYDLIPNLVETAKGYIKHERETLEAVIKARNQRGRRRAGGAARTRATRRRCSSLGAAEGALTGVLGRLFALAEAYPDLKANQNMLALQEELTSTENKVAFARQAFNDSVMEYNTKRESFPDNIFAGMFGFGPAELLAADRVGRGAQGAQGLVLGSAPAAASPCEFLRAPGSSPGATAGSWCCSSCSPWSRWWRQSTWCWPAPGSGAAPRSRPTRRSLWRSSSGGCRQASTSGARPAPPASSSWSASST